MITKQVIALLESSDATTKDVLNFIMSQPVYDVFYKFYFTDDIEAVIQLCIISRCIYEFTQIYGDIIRPYLYNTYFFYENYLTTRGALVKDIYGVKNTLELVVFCSTKHCLQAYSYSSDTWKAIFLILSCKQDIECEISVDFFQEFVKQLGNINYPLKMKHSYNNQPSGLWKLLEHRFYEPNEYSEAP